MSGQAYSNSNSSNNSSSVITLTGATLEQPRTNNHTTNSNSNTIMSHNHHSHSHDHGSGGSGAACQHSHHGGGGDMELTSTTTPLSVEELLQGSLAELSTTVTTLLRYGRFEALEPLLNGLQQQAQAQKTTTSDDEDSNTKNTKIVFPQLLMGRDDQGHSLFHWAAKRGDDLRFLSTLLDLAIQYQTMDVVRQPSQDSVGMTPLHWACTEASIPHVACLLQKGQAELEAKDSSGCTPLLIAAQYGQVEVVAYLLQQGAQLQALDKSGDSALHWASYKGSIPVCGLLGYYGDALTFGMVDQYGQTPLHLAALRGHTSVVRYILRQLQVTHKTKDVLNLPDKNGRTPLDLAIHKNRPNVQVVLKEAMAALENPRGYYFCSQSLLRQCQEMVSPKSWKQWMITGSDEMDVPPKAPFYYLVANYVLHFWLVIACFVPVYNAGSGLLWDKSGWILLNLIWTGVSWYTFYKTVTTPPGFMDASSHKHFEYWQSLYERTLEQYAQVLDKASMEGLPQLCHTCHIARPHRSKHCKVQRKCVLVFDHFCPFVDNTIGLYNYKYFYGFLVSTFFALGTFCITMLIYLSRYHKEHGSYPWWTVAIFIEIAICFLPVAGMAGYHTQLVMVNLTTNEHINTRRYRYLWNPKTRKYRNPWFKNGYWGNFMDRMYPSDACYMIAEEEESLIHAGGATTAATGEEVV